MDSFSENKKNVFCLVLLSFLCWGGFLTLRGIWWDDWAWVWVYFDTKGMSGFMLPFKSLRKEIEGTLIYSIFKLFEPFGGAATQIWNVLKFVIFTCNAVLLYLSVKTIQRSETILPETIAVAYLVSPAVNNFCSANIGYYLEVLFFLLSIFFSVRAAKENNPKGINYKLSFIFAIFPVVALGTYIFFDLLRAVVVLYILLEIHNIKTYEALKRTVLFHYPFLLLGVSALLYTKLMPQYGQYKSLYAIKEHGFNLLAGVTKRYWASFWYFVSLYVHSVSNTLKNIFTINVLLSVIAAYLVFLFLLKKEKTIINASEDSGAIKEIKAYVIFGALAMLLGSFPVCYGWESCCFRFE